VSRCACHRSPKKFRKTHEEATIQPPVRGRLRRLDEMENLNCGKAALVPGWSVGERRTHRAWLQGNRLKTRDADWNGFVRTNWRHFLFVLRTEAMAQGRGTFVIEIIADPIRVEHLDGDELPADVAKAVTEGEFITAIDSKAVGKRQRLSGFLDDCALVSAGDQERSDDEKEKCLSAHERLGWIRNQRFRCPGDYSISGNPDQFRKTRSYFHKRNSALCHELG
jgi:hypothetical protein